jgi:predicted transcriptional regulator
MEMEKSCRQDIIPGLPRTDEEKLASIREAEEDIRAGRVYTMEEMRQFHPRVSCCQDIIPGLPRTDEEKLASIREAEEDIRAGRVHTMEEVFKPYEK